MIAYIQGKYTHKAPTEVYIDVNGLGYDVQISLQTYAAIENTAEGKLFTHLLVKEDSHTLYGFATKKEKELFLLLISVSGIGPNTARIILSSMSAQEVANTIAAGDDVSFQRVKGIGAKTAKRIILDLKDKVNKGLDENAATSPMSNSAEREAIDALMTLGFQQKKIMQALQKIGNDRHDMPVEEIIKSALTILS